MMNFLKKYLNNDILYTGLNQLWRLISGPLLLILIPLYLSPEEQGYWYTFTSLAALAIFADLGFSTIILQFSAHEFAFLQFNERGAFVGDDLHLIKIATLFTFCIKWAVRVSLIAFPIILVIGYFFLSQKNTTVSWHIPWLLYGISSAIVFINSIILCFFEGCNLVGKVQNTRFKIAILASITMVLGLVLELKLHALSFSLLINFLIGIFLIYRQFGSEIIQLIVLSRISTYSWENEFFSLLWKYAISWSSGYFIFQLYTPLTFQFHGPVEAGRVGISMALWSALFGISSIWITSVTPKLNIYVSKKNWLLLDKLFLKSLALSTTTYLLGLIIILLFIFFSTGKLSIIDRFVSASSMILLGISWLLQTTVTTLAVYLRAHKEEPLLVLSVVSAIYIALSTFFCAKLLSADYLFVGYFSSYLFVFPWILHIFYKRRRRHFAS